MFMGIQVTDLTAPVLLGITVLMILSGLLVPRRVYKDKAEESERWQQSFETERERANISDAQTAQLLEAQKTSHALNVAIFEAIKTLQPRGDRDDVAT